MKLLQRAPAIKEHCKICSAWTRAELHNCTVLTCPLWPWRFGKLVPKAELDRWLETEPLKQPLRARKRHLGSGLRD